MKKLLSTIILGILILSGFGTVALQDKEIQEEKMTLSFSQLSMKEKDNFVFIELEGANSVLMKKDHYMVPTKIETFTFPFGTEITGVQCTPKNIHKQTLTKELMIASEPVILSKISSNEISQKCENPISIDTWFEYDAGVGINGNERCVFVKVQTYPVQYNPSENLVKWSENIEIDISYKEPEKTTLSFDDEYPFIVLTASEYSDELQDLINHKTGRGLSTKLVTLD